MVLGYLITVAWIVLAVYHYFNGHSEFAAIFMGMAYLSNEVRDAKRKKEKDDVEG